MSRSLGPKFSHTIFNGSKGKIPTTEEHPRVLLLTLGINPERV